MTDRVDEIKEAVAEVLELEVEEMKTETILEDIPNFDSVKILALMSALDDVGVAVNHNDVEKIKSIGDIYSLAGI